MQPGASRKHRRKTTFSRPPRRRTSRPTDPTKTPRDVQDVSLIIPAFNEADGLRQSLPGMIRWPEVKEVIVIANGCTDNTANVASRAGAKVLNFPMRLGHDTGRAIGAKAATGNYILFLDGDIAWQRKDILPFVRALRRGADVALNRYPAPADKTYDHPTAIAKRALNLAMYHPEWKASSLTAVPHGIRRSALARIGCEALAVPPLALAKASVAGLKIVRPHYVNVGLRNRWSRRYGPGYSTQNLILGDHVQALAYLLSVRGWRGGFMDGTRARQFLQTVTQADTGEEFSVPSHDKQPNIATAGLANIANVEARTLHASADPFESKPEEEAKNPLGPVAVIPAHNERRTLPAVLRQVRKMKLEKILVVENGSNDGTQRMIGEGRVDVLHFKQPLGHDVGRAILAKTLMHHSCTLFVDADIPISYRSLIPFRDSVLHRGTDVAVNRLGQGLPLCRRRDAVSTMKTFLNIALGRPKLGLASLTAVPHALSQKALQTIPGEELAVPPKAYARAVLSGLTVRPVKYVDVIRQNRRRPQLHRGQVHSRMSRMIIGDHLEAVELLIQKRGIRGGFEQPRRLDVLHHPDKWL